jgi:hypothetical protein
LNIARNISFHIPEFYEHYFFITPIFSLIIQNTLIHNFKVAIQYFLLNPELVEGLNLAMTRHGMPGEKHPTLPTPSLSRG